MHARTHDQAAVGGPGSSHFLPFEEAAGQAQLLKLNGAKEWQQWCKSGKRPANLPSNPDQSYRNTGWKGWGHWLGTGNVVGKGRVSKRFPPFEEALKYAHSLNLKGVKDWQRWCKSGSRPPHVPSNPDQAYKNTGWQGYGHWLGTGNRIGKKQTFLPFAEALQYVHPPSLVPACRRRAAVVGILHHACSPVYNARARA